MSKRVRVWLAIGLLVVLLGFASRLALPRPAGWQRAEVAEVGLVPERGGVVLLKAERGELFPVFIGVNETFAIGSHMAKVRPPRPLTHDLTKSIITTLGARMEEIQIVDIRGDTIIGNLVLARQRERFDVDCRPSDGIALALRFGAPIKIKTELLRRPPGKVRPEEVLPLPSA